MQSVNLAARVAGRLAPIGGARRCGDENGVFNEELWLPSHGRYVASGAVSRVMNYLCFPNSKGVVRALQRSFAWSHLRTDSWWDVRSSRQPVSPLTMLGVRCRFGS